MRAIIKKEFSSFFTSPVGFIVLAIFLFFSGMYFTRDCISAGSAMLSSVFGNCFFIYIFIIPLITMRSFAEEKKQKTDQLLLTSPVSVTKIVLGKFIGAYLMFCLCTSVFIIYGLVLTAFSNPHWSLILSTLFGTLLFGAALTAIGVFISSLTENQIIAAVVTLAIGIVIYLLDTFAALISAEAVTSLLLRLSFIAAYSNFSLGHILASDVIYMLSVTVCFLFLTVRSVDRRRFA